MPDWADAQKNYCPACDKNPCVCAFADNNEEEKKPENPDHKAACDLVRSFLPSWMRSSVSEPVEEERHYSCTCTFGEFGRETGGCMEHGNGRRLG